jgi:Leucine-rich repeat (LRR) protein
MADKLLKSRRLEKVEVKVMKEFIPEVDETIKIKLHSIANKGYGATQPTIITIEEIQSAISEWKQENQIYSQEITPSNCTELALSFKKILQIANLDNLLKLEKLKLDNNMIMKIENLDHLLNLKWLDLSFNSITKIEGLDKLENLLDLSLFNNQIQEVEGLDNCRKLNVLSIGRNNIQNPKDVKFKLYYLLDGKLFEKIFELTSTECS